MFAERFEDAKRCEGTKYLQSCLDIIKLILRLQPFQAKQCLSVVSAPRFLQRAPISRCIGEGEG